MYILKNGKVCSRIVLPLGVSEIETFAAEELQRYVKSISGKKIPFVQKPSSKVANIHLFCDPELADEKEDTFEIQIAADSIYLKGQNPRGVLYATYSFLEEELGVGFLAPGVENEWIPSANTISLEHRMRRECPVMRIRGYSAEDLDEIDWMAKNKMNYCLIGDAGTEIPHVEYRKRGFKKYYAGHSFYLWVPPKKYWKKHPEYYSLIDSKRVCTWEHGVHLGHQQLCLSNPDVIRIAVDNICRFIKAHKEYEYITLWPEDAPNFCQCAKCRKLDKQARPLDGRASNAGSYIYFVQKVAEVVGKKYPQIKLNAIAYNTTFYPPTNPKFYVPENVVLEVAFWGRCADKANGETITDAEIKKRVKNAGIPLERVDEFKHHYRDYEQILRQWKKLTRGDLLTYDYAMASQSTLSLPYPAFGSLLKDQKFYEEIDSTGCYMQAHKLNHVAYGLNYWCGGKAYWGGYVNPDKLLTDWCGKMFGLGAEDMKRYYKMLERSFKQMAGWYYPYTASRIMTKKTIENGFECLSLAARKVKNKQRKLWLENIQLHFEYSRHMRECFDMSREVEYLCDKDQGDQAFDATMRLYRKVVETAEFVQSLKGRNILGIGRLVLYWLLKQEVVAYDLTRTIGTGEVTEKLAKHLLPTIYDQKGW